jgi:D-alanyl-D-alanine carboxypeptidase
VAGRSALPAALLYELTLPMAHLARLLCVILSLALAWAPPALARSSGPAYAAIVMDARTGEVLHARSADATRHPASLTKMMTLMMVFDALDAGTLSLDTRMRVSARAAKAKPSKLGLAPGSTLTVRDAIYALVTKSANDVAVVVAEHLGGSEPRFAQRMTQRARELGLRRTYFKNASGLHNPGQVTTARDMARLARALMVVHPRRYHYFSTRSFTYKGQTYANHNRLMRSYPGMDGLKTGYVAASGFNLAASAVRGSRRLIGVVIGGRSTKSRNEKMRSILDASFARLGVDGTDIRVASAPQPPPRRPGALAGALAQTEVAEGDAADAGDAAARVAAGLAAVRAHRVYLDAQKAPPADTPLLAAPAQDPYAGAWAIQVGAFGSRATAESATVEALASLPQDLVRPSGARVTPLATPGGGVLHRARIAGYTSRVEAARACAHLASCVPVGL